MAANEVSMSGSGPSDTNLCVLEGELSSDPWPLELESGSVLLRCDVTVRAGGVEAPAAWVLKQDHSKTGLVWELHPEGVDAGAVVRLLLEGTSLLCPIPVKGRWTATLNRPR